MNSGQFFWADAKTGDTLWTSEPRQAGNAAIVHDNPFNRWTAGEGQFYFETVDECAAHFDALDGEDSSQPLRRAREAAVRRHQDGLTWPRVLEQYETVLSG